MGRLFCERDIFGNAMVRINSHLNVSAERFWIPEAPLKTVDFAKTLTTPNQSFWPVTEKKVGTEYLPTLRGVWDSGFPEIFQSGT